MEKKASKFKIFFAIFVLLDVLLMAAGLSWLWMNLDSYEKSQVIRGAEQGAQLFRERDYAEIRQKSGFTPSRFAAEQEMDQYLAQKLEGAGEIHCVKLRSSGKQAEYAIKSGDQMLAKAVLQKSETADRFGRSHWELNQLEEVFEESESYTICAPQNVTVTVNGQKLTEEELKDDAQIPQGYRGLGENMPKPLQYLYEVSGLLQEPQVSADAGEGLCCEVRSDPQNPRQLTVVVRPDAQQVEELGPYVLNAAKTYARFITQDAAFGELSQYLVKNSKFYDSVRTFYNGWYVTHDSHRFADEKTEEWMWYDQTHLSCRVSFLYTIQKGQRTFEYPSAYEVYLANTQSGWQVTDMVVL